MKFKFFFPIILLLVTSEIIGQETDFTNDSKKYDFSEIFKSDSIYTNIYRDGYKRNEPLGYIGKNYQRFFIHFISVIKNPDNPSEYLVYGKTRVEKNICDFQGKIFIKKVITYSDIDFPGIKRGELHGDYLFYEDSKNKSSGYLKGAFKTFWFFDAKNKPIYDALKTIDSYCNNLFWGSWIGYQGNSTLTCNWGDSRIPDSEDLDNGAGEIVINSKYQKNGWDNFIKAYQSKDAQSIESQKARKIEEEKWWKN